MLDGIIELKHFLEQKSMQNSKSIITQPAGLKMCQTLAKVCYAELKIITWQYVCYLSTKMNNFVDLIFTALKIFSRLSIIAWKFCKYLFSHKFQKVFHTFNYCHTFQCLSIKCHRQILINYFNLGEYEVTNNKISNGVLCTEVNVCQR